MMSALIAGMARSYKIVIWAVTLRVGTISYGLWIPAIHAGIQRCTER